MLAAAERDVRVGMTGDLEVLGIVAEDFLVAVGRAVEHDDGVALFDALAADFDVGGRGARHVRHRGGPAQHLLDRCRDERGVGDQLGALVRVVDQGQGAQRDEVAGGLVARHQQQEGEVQQIVVGELFAVDLGAGQNRQHVVARVLAPRGDELDEVLVQLADGRERVHLDLGVGDTGTCVGPSTELLPVLGRRTEQLRDHPGGQGSGDPFGELEGGAGFDIVEEPVHDLADLRLQDGNPPPGEAGVDQLAQLPMARRVGEDEVALLHRVLRQDRVGNRDALGRGEQGRVARYVADVLVLQQRPELRDVVPDDGRRGAQFLVGGVRIADEEVRGMQGERGGQQASLDIIVRLGHFESKCLMLTVYSPLILLSIRVIDDIGPTGVDHVLIH